MRASNSSNQGHKHDSENAACRSRNGEEAEAPRAAYLLAKYGVFTPEHSLLGSYNPNNSGGQRITTRPSWRAAD
jgi:hypothetical protein